MDYEEKCQIRDVVREYIAYEDCPVCGQSRRMIKFWHYEDDKEQDRYRCVGCLNLFKKIMVKARLTEPSPDAPTGFSTSDNIIVDMD